MVFLGRTPHRPKQMNYTMIFHCAQLSLICLIFASTVQVKRTPEQLALPRVTCAARRMRAVFGPKVKSNIHVRGKTVLFGANCLSFQPNVVVNRLKTTKLHRYFKGVCTIGAVSSDATGAAVLVPESEGPCGLRLARGINQSLSVFSRYDSCYALIEVISGLLLG